MSPEVLKVKTPEIKYPSVMSNSFNLNDAGTSMFSPSLSITPNTRKYISDLTELPSSSEKNKVKFLNTTSTPNLQLKNEQLKNRCKRLQKLLNKKRATISFLKQHFKPYKKKQKINIKEFLHLVEFPSISSKSLVTMQINHKSLRCWLNSISYSTGFSPRYMEQIKLKVSCMSFQEKKVTILLDEISIKKAIEYNKALDIIEGYEDLGTLGRTNKIGSYALVIMIRCLYVNCKFPFCYFFTGNRIKGDNLTNILKECVIKLLELGLVPSAVVCDQGSQNRRMFSLLGATYNNPSVDINGQKLFLIYDMPHLIKSLRNNLLDGNIKIENKLISFKDIKKSYEIDLKSNTARAMCKITPAHIAPNAFKKMSCKLAIQIFSRSVAAAIKTCVSTGELKTKTALDTANFIENVNDMFDSANSKHLYDANPNRRPLSKRNSQVLQNLKNFCILFDKAVKINSKNNKVTTPPCFIGLKWTLTAIIGLYESEKIIMNQHISNKEYFLMTNKLTQDPLENMFSIMRQKNGYNKNPTARTFRCCFSAICSYSLMKCSESSNCEEDGEEFFNVDTLNDVQITRPTYSEEMQEDGLNDIYNLSDDCETDSNTSSGIIVINTTNDKKSLENCAVIYFAGYLAYKCLNNFSCDECKKNLITSIDLNDESQLLLTFKMFNVNEPSTQGLKAPSNI
ncbi:THAP-type domain-containing protein, partial [Aphis craccivora]